MIKTKPGWSKITTIDMHTGGEPLRIFTDGLPEIPGNTMLEKRGYFRDHLDYQTFDFTCPEGADCIYDPEPMEKVDNFVRHQGENMIFIYGEWDPWLAPGVQISGKTNSFKVVKPEGSHGTRIRNLPEDQRQKVLNALGNWLDCEINW